MCGEETKTLTVGSWPATRENEPTLSLPARLGQLQHQEWEMRKGCEWKIGNG